MFMRALSVSTLFALMAWSQSGKYVFEPASGDRFELRVYKSGLLSGKNHVFLFDKFQGTADETKVEFTIQSASLSVHDDWTPAKSKLDEIKEVALNEMLEVKKHPELKFVSTSVKKKSDNAYDVAGTLTIKSQSKPVTVSVERKSDGFWEGKAQIKHSDYGLKQQSAALGTIGTKDEMDVIFRLKGAKP